MKKNIAIGIVGFLAGIAVFFGVRYYNNRFDLKINSQVVDSEEYLYVMNQQIYDVTKDSDRQIDSEFWDKEHNGETPYKKLADNTIEKLKYNRAVYENAKEQGYVDEIDYKHIVERMEQENKNRKEKIAKGEPVYGLSEFSIELFMEYEMDTFQKRYCDNLDNEGMDITDEERNQYYEENKDILFEKYDDLTLDYVKINYSMDQLGEEDVKNIKSEMLDIYKKIDAEHSLKELAGQSEVLSQYLVHEEILSGELSAKAKVIGDVIEYAYDLGKGESTQVIDENGALYLIQCTDKVDYDYLPFEEVKDNINKKLREQHYDMLIEQKAKESKVDAQMNKVYDFTLKHIKK